MFATTKIVHREYHMQQPQTKVKPIPVRTKPMSKEEFLIQYVLARASFRADNFSGTAAARAANDVWKEIQKIK